MLGLRWTAAALALLLAATALPPFSAAAGTGLGLGVNVDGAAAMAAAGARPTYASFWVGQWMAQSGWGGLDSAIASARASGATPLVYWYYWGDSISPACVESGCSGKSRAQWDDMTTTLVQRLDADLGGAPTVIVLENEFNKNGVDASGYAPTFDGYLAAKAAALHQVPNAKVVLGFGGWGEGSWGLFPQAIAASDLVGFQTMRASTKDTVASYTGAPDRVAQLVAAAQGAGGKGSFLYDLALSSYPNATWEAYQNQTLAAILARAPQLVAGGLQGIVYREIDDNPGMSPANYYGYAEQHWGLRDGSGNPKAAWATWLAGASASAAPALAPGPNVPGSFEAESMKASAGGRVADSAASGGALWNLWSNGTLTQTLASSGGDFTITVAARGTPAAGVDAAMDVRLDGATLGSFAVPAGSLTSYAVNATLPNGTATLAIVFTNDLMTAAEDRNLLVDVVRVAPMDHAPVASLAVKGANLSWSFDASASSDPDGDALAYAWDFGDGTGATGASVTHAYAGAGAYPVTLAVSDGQATSRASATVQATRPNAPPSAAFSVVGANLTWSFDASASQDPDGDALSYAWDFGDGSGSSGVAATHAYASAGSYAVTLRVDDGHGASATAAATVGAKQPDRAPNATLALSGANLTWTFDASRSTDPDGDPLTFSWDLGDGATATGATVTHAYRAAGAYRVTLTASDGALAGSAAASVQATAPAPQASLRATGGGAVWSFDATGSTGSPTSYAWDFGDGARASGPLANHTYAAPGSYNVTLTVSNGQASVARQAVVATPYAAAFSTRGGNAWWVAGSVSANEPTQSVCATVNGSACQPLRLQSWGEWAASFPVPSDARVVFVATSVAGHVAASPTYLWPSGAPLFSASFSGVSGNNWWVQASVAANQTLAGVCASVNGGACQALALQGWGGWAASFHVPTGAKVVLRATSANGQTVASAAYAWSSKVG